MSGSGPKTALCLPGGGITGALYQIGALAALQDGIQGLDGQSFSLYLGQSSGASVAAALAGGIEVDRLYRALLDPANPTVRVGVASAPPPQVALVFSGQGAQHAGMGRALFHERGPFRDTLLRCAERG